MKKVLVSIMVIMLFLSSLNSCFCENMINPVGNDEEYYLVSDIGISFIIPSGWTLEELPADDSYKVKMSIIPKENERNTMIYFNWMDLWNVMSEELKMTAGLSSRESLDCQYLNEVYAAKLFGCNAEDISLFANSDIVFAIKQQHDEGLKLTITSVITIINGYIIMFQMHDFNGTYGDALESVLESITLN